MGVDMPWSARIEPNGVVHARANTALYRGWERKASESGRTAPVYNQATAEQSAVVSLASASEVREAVEEAVKIAPNWAATTPLRRSRILNRFLRILEQRIDELAAVITKEIPQTTSRSSPNTRNHNSVTRRLIPRN
jgi:acyl-CoA reductase-like NAD-dependent aldehyde dehydrogenase